MQHQVHACCNAWVGSFIKDCTCIFSTLVSNLFSVSSNIVFCVIPVEEFCTDSRHYLELKERIIKFIHFAIVL